MDEREILEHAAKAAGYRITKYQDGIYKNITGMPPEANALAAPIWNPLKNKADAFDLACRLKMCVDFSDLSAALYYSCLPDDWTYGRGSTPEEKIMDAITRVAAEVGRG